LEEVPADAWLTWLRSLKLYNKLVERCFNDCVQDFRSKNLDKEEEKVRGWFNAGVSIAPAGVSIAPAGVSIAPAGVSIAPKQRQQGKTAERE
jgi:hypothetical protein